MQCKNSAIIHIRKSTRPEPEQKKVYTILNLKSHPGKTIKKIIKNEQ